MPAGSYTMPVTVVRAPPVHAVAMQPPARQVVWRHWRFVHGGRVMTGAPPAPVATPVPPAPVAVEPPAPPAPDRGDLSALNVQPVATKRAASA